MSLADRNPHTILLSGGFAQRVSSGIGVEKRHRAGAAITPGMLVEMYEVTNELKWRANASATELCARSVMIDKPYETDNTGIDDAVAANENVHVAYLQPGDEFLSKVVSGETVAIGTLLQSNGNGWLKAATVTTQAAQLGWLQAIEELNGAAAIASDTRCRVRVVG